MTTTLVTGPTFQQITPASLLPMSGVTDPIIAHAGGGIPGAPVLETGMINWVTVCASTGDSVVLPSAMPGAFLAIAGTNTITHTIGVLPRTGESVNGVANGQTNLIPSTQPGAIGAYICFVKGAWLTNLAID